jgi:hypothetical protein
MVTSILLAGWYFYPVGWFAPLLLPLLFYWLFWYFSPTGWFASLLFATSIFIGWWYFNLMGCFAPHLFGTSILLAGWYFTTLLTSGASETIRWEFTVTALPFFLDIEGTAGLFLCDA